LQKEGKTELFKTTEDTFIGPIGYPPLVLMPWAYPLSFPFLYPHKNIGRKKGNVEAILKTADHFLHKIFFYSECI